MKKLRPHLKLALRLRPLSMGWQLALRPLYFQEHRLVLL
jgi:hypothetical protein